MTATLDASALTKLAAHDRTTMARLQRLLERDLWPPVVPTWVLVESLTGRGPRDARVNRLLRTCDIIDLDAVIARRAAALRTRARAGSAVDAIVVATAEAEASNLVITGDRDDITKLAGHAHGVSVMPI
ncbi:MAG TPA: PIN domain-containing protein [Acidimicrobiia bacterium]|jgi:predicted nucleic acid-binding protein